MVYVALLRGINVGGNNKIAMSELAKCFGSLGLDYVITYINSGNVIFRSDRDEQLLVPLVEKAIEKDFGINIRVVLLDLYSIKLICESTPKSWTNDSDQKTDVMFLWKEIDNEELENKIVVDSKLENIIRVPGALVWNISRQFVTRGNGIKLIKSDLYKHMTVRNINTVRKIYDIMKTKV